MKDLGKILVVDDDPNLRKTLADILRVKGYDCVVAGSGAEAIAAVEREKISLALIDLMLPDISGLDVMERIKAVAPLTEAIILTGHASLDTAIEATRRGAFSYLLKPYQMDDLLQNIRHGVERQQAQSEIRRLSEALRQSQEAIVVVDADLRFEYVNPAFTRLLGYTLEDLKGRSVALIGVADAAAADPPQAAGIAAEQGGFTGETVRRAKDGRIVPVLLNVAPIRDELGRITDYVGTMTDLSGIRRMEESLRESEEKFRSISASAHDAVIMLDENGAISFWNAAAETIFGYPADAVLGQDLHTLCAPASHRQAFREGFAKFSISGQGAAVGKTVERTAIRRGGDEFPIEISLSAVRHKERWQAIGIVRDISERKQAEQEARNYAEALTRTNVELQSLNARLEKAQNQLLQSEKMASVGLLAAGVAHEINNPVGYVYSNLGALENYLADIFALVGKYEAAEQLTESRAGEFEEVRQFKAKIDLDYLRGDIQSLLRESRQGLLRVKKIVLDLKDFSHANNEEEWQWADVNQGLENTLSVVWNELKYKCEVHKEYGNLPPVQCLPSQLNQVFMNLLVNAAQAIDVHGIVTLRSGREQDQVWVEVADTGKGIAPEDLPRLFDPFFTTKPVGKGTGLGLAVSYSIVEKHHGRFEVHSEPGKGATFRVWLPIKQLDGVADRGVDAAPTDPPVSP